MAGPFRAGAILAVSLARIAMFLRESTSTLTADHRDRFSIVAWSTGAGSAQKQSSSSFHEKRGHAWPIACDAKGRQ